MAAPNMATLYLTDNLAEFVMRMNKILPFREWKCYLGYCDKNVAGEEDGIVVSQKKSEMI